MGKVMTKNQLMSLRLKGKPKCPHCDKPLVFVYEGSTGYSGEKCQRCRKEYLINTGTLEVIEILKAG